MEALEKWKNGTWEEWRDVLDEAFDDGASFFVGATEETNQALQEAGVLVQTIHGLNCGLTTVVKARKKGAKDKEEKDEGDEKMKWSALVELVFGTGSDCATLFSLLSPSFTQTLTGSALRSKRPKLGSFGCFVVVDWMKEDRRRPLVGDIEGALDLLENPDQINTCGALVVYSVKVSASGHIRCHLHQIFVNYFVRDRKQFVLEIVLTLAALLQDPDSPPLPHCGSIKIPPSNLIQYLTVPPCLSAEVSTLLKGKCGFHEQIHYTPKKKKTKGSANSGPMTEERVLQVRVSDLMRQAMKLEKRRISRA